MKASIKNHDEQQQWISGDILMDILSRLPARSVMRFRCVSKHWHALTLDPFFIKMHLSHVHRHAPSVLIRSERRISTKALNFKLHLYSLDAADTYRLNAITTIEKHNHCWSSEPCNGLICLSGDTGIVVLNLTTQESITIPKPSHMHDVPSYNLILAYKPSTNKYILIVHRNLVFMTMTLGSGTWTTISSDICSRFFSTGSRFCSTGSRICSSDSRFFSCGLCVDGIVYYLIDVTGRHLYTCIVSLDLEDWSFRDVIFPCPDSSATVYEYRLYNLRGKLCLTHRCPSDCFDAFDIWVLKDAVKGLWSKEHRILPPIMLYPRLRCFLTVYNGHVFLHDQLIFCAIGEGSFEFFVNEKLDTRCSVFAYTETLVDVKSFA